ncbi:MAG: threonine-phosphate decarboxylase CobD, partial [Bdellovibrionia bacterium]
MTGTINVTRVHGGNLKNMADRAGCRREEILDFSANINPLGFPEWVRPLINSRISELVHYPDPNYSTLRSKMAQHYSISEDEIIIGNGSSEILYVLPAALKINRVILPVPSYSDYEAAARLFRLPIETLHLLEEDDFALDISQLDLLLCKQKVEDRIGVFIGNPNNPTGRTVSAASVREIARKHAKAVFVIDEAFIDFTNGSASLQSDRPKNVVILHSMTKILAIPGLRVGFALADSEIARAIQSQIPPWSVNNLAAAVMERALDDQEFFAEGRIKISQWREDLKTRLSATGCVVVFPGEANYLLLKISKAPLTSGELADRLLLGHRIGIRNCENYLGLGDQYFRIAVRRPDENNRLISAFEAVVGVPRSKHLQKPKLTPALMLQGTGSNVGKSILTTALCRILYQDGVKVSPFKSQNMALNSFVTPSGGEIGRAQALQAQACKLVPDVRMNPVLLKPSNESGSQVILCGKPLAHMDFRDYSRFKATVFEEVKRAYDSLAAESDVVLLEGAGSASEVNLKKNDIVNMRMA